MKKKKRVLLVDDNMVFLEAANNILKTINGAVIVGSVNTGEEAVNKIVREQLDIVLMDITMPGMGGLAATRIIKKMLRPPRVIILTLHDTSEYRKEAINAGADGFISKSDFAKSIPSIFS